MYTYIYIYILFSYIYIYIYIYHIYPTPPLEQDMTQGQFFLAEFNRFEFKVFLLLD